MITLSKSPKTSALWPPRPGRAGFIFGGVETPGGVVPLRWDDEIGIELTGKQGSGKTRGPIMSSLLITHEHEDAWAWTASQRRLHQNGWESLKIVLDIKGTLTKTTSGYRNFIGEKVFVIDPYSDDEGVAKYNPFDRTRTHTKFMFSDCSRLAGWVCEPMSSSADATAKYFDATAIEAMGGFIGHNAFRAIVENDPTINSPAGLITFLSGFEKIEDAIDAVLEYEHDPHGVAGWDEELEGKLTGKKTKTCPWIAQTMRVLASKAADEKSGIYGSTLKDLPIYRDPRIKANTTTSTFAVEDLVNDPAQSAIIYIRMPYADLEQLKPYVRLVVNDWLYRLMPPAIAIDGREARGNLRPFLLLLEECAALRRVEQIERAASFIRGLGGTIVTAWQNRNQVEATYGKIETISGNQGLHIFFTPETDKEAEALSTALGETSFLVQERNVSGERMAMLPRDHLAESNRIQDRRHRTPYEIKALANDKLIFFSRGIQAEVLQYHYDKNPELLRRSQIPPPKESDVTTTVPFCIANMEATLGAAKYALAIKPAPDPFARNYAKAVVQPNGCRLYTWEDVRAETGIKAFFAQLWLPGATKPVLNDRKGCNSALERTNKVKAAMKVFDERDNVEKVAAPIFVTPEAAALSIFNGESFA